MYFLIEKKRTIYILYYNFIENWCYRQSLPNVAVYWQKCLPLFAKKIIYDLWFK